MTSYLSVLLSQIFFQTDPFFHYVLCCLCADIAVMPRLVSDSGDIALVCRIAQNKAVFRAMLHQPLLYGRIFLLYVEPLVGGVDNVYGKPCLVLASITATN